MSEPTPPDPAASSRLAVVGGFFLLAVFLPMGLTLEALHALKLEVYMGSSMRREMWTLAHAHGGVLGLLCLAYGALADRYLPAGTRRGIARWLLVGAILMPLGFFLGGIGNAEGDPSLGIVLVPVGGLVLLVAVLRAGLGCCKVDAP